MGLAENDGGHFQRGSSVFVEQVEGFLHRKIALYSGCVAPGDRNLDCPATGFWHLQTLEPVVGG